MNSAFKNAIAKIVEAVPDDQSFDTHLVIQQLMDWHMPLYEEFISDRDLNIAHSEISIVIRDSTLVSRSQNRSYSRTVNDTYNSVAGWVRNQS